MPRKRYKAEEIVSEVRQVDVPREWSPELFGHGTGLAPPERKWKG
jgi:hypothetical protein